MGIKCIVCGMESDRADWVGNPRPSCDSHRATTTPAQPIDIDTNVIKEEAEKHKAPPPAPTSHENPVKHFIHEVEKKVEQKIHHKPSHKK